MRVDPGDVAALRAFVERGGGLLIAGAAMHWSWWLSDSAERYVGDLITDGTGIRWNFDSTQDLTSVAARFDPLALPETLWCAYLAGDALTPLQLARLAPVFQSAHEIGRAEEVTRALTRLLDETPALPASASDAAARLSADVASVLGPRDWPRPHPWAAAFPGAPTTTTAIDRTVSVDASWRGAQERRSV